MEPARLDAVLEAARHLPLEGTVACRAVVVDAPEMRAALARAATSAAGDPAATARLGSAPILVALCDLSRDGDGRPAAWIAAAQMAAVAEIVGLATLLVPVAEGPDPPSGIPLPPGGRLVAVLGLGQAMPAGAPDAGPAPAGVEVFVATAPPPRPMAAEGRDERRVLISFMEIASTTAGVEDLDEVLRTIARELGRLFPVDGASIALLEEEGIVVREILRRGGTVRRDPERLPADGSHLMGRVIGSGQPLWRNDVPAELRFAESLPGTGMRSDMVIPLRTRGQIIGAFGVACRRRHAFDPEDFELLKRCADMTALAVDTQRLLQKTRRLSETDGLTGVNNHRHCLGLLEQEIEAARNSGRTLALLMVDVDDFKKFNDTHGHQAGDEVLRHVVRVTGRLLRRTDVLGRYGGEEFAVILPDAPIDGALSIAETIRAGIETSPVALPGAPHPLGVRVSIGAAGFPDDGGTASDLVAAADRGLYLAKRSGKNRVCRCQAPGTEPPA